MRIILNTVLKLFNEWNENHICYCHWKSNEHLYAGLTGETDLDILMSSRNKDSAERILINCGYLKFIPQYGSKYENVDDWIGCDSITGRLVHIHLHYKMITGHKGMKEYDLPWTECALNTRVMHSEFPIYIVNPNLEIIILISRICLKATIPRIIKTMFGRFKLSVSDCLELEYLLSLADMEEVKAIAKLYFGKEYENFTSLVFSLKRDAKWFTNCRRIVTKNLSKYNRYGFFPNIIRLYFSFALKIRQGLKKHLGFNLITRKTLNNGTIIAFVGQDGAGKSTVSNEIIKWLTWKIDAKKYYLGSGEHYHSWQKSIRSKIRKRSGFANIVNSILVVSDLRKIAKSTYKKIKAADKYVSKGGIAIFDRYPQLQYEGINDGPKIRVSIQNKKPPFILRKILLQYANSEEKYIRKAVAIQPNLVFKLVLSPEESFRRKPDESFLKIEQKHEIVKKLSFDKSSVIVIDANMDFNEEIKTIHLSIWDFLSNRG